MIRDWDTVREVLIEVSEITDPHFGREYYDVVAATALAATFGDFDSPNTAEVDAHETEKWLHARQLLHAGMFLSPVLKVPSTAPGGFRVGGLSWEGEDLLAALNKSDVRESLKELATKGTLTVAGEVAKTLVNAAMKGNLPALINGITGS